ncbi:MAG: PAS domain S-box protein [Proteobacteria bacterium]|nr:PAS domain S-box protein [Pseudomonadota bacterium]MBU4471830.1 PAS domain S-box protein [Pseudomonadota bacterium]MCG2750610.1 ATP-binding protein [Desulfobacteraceae bacterium]
MQTQKNNEYLLKAIDAFRKRFFVISTEFEILAINQGDGKQDCSTGAGEKCFETFFGQKEACGYCPAKQIFLSREPVMWEADKGSSGEGRGSCLYAYPIMSGDTIEALAIMDFQPPILTGLEEKLQRSNAFFRNLMLSSVDGVIAADKTGKVLVFNEAASEISGHGVEEALEHLDIRQVYPEGGAKEVMRKLRSDEFGGKGKLKSCQVDFLRKTGEVIPISLNAAIVYEGEKEVATIGYFHDLRENIRMKTELEKTQVQLLQSEKMASLGKLAAGVAHQLNNPLGGITLFTKLMMEEYTLEEGVMNDLKRILKDAERCRDTVKELLEFARQTQQRMQLNDINRAITRTFFLLENQTLFQNITIQKQLAENIPKVPGDIQQLNHLFMNIILNAAQAMKGAGKLIVKTMLEEEKDRVRIEISDTGPGIPDEILSQIFDPFFTTKDEGEGTGLGLSIVYGIVQNHGGKISVKTAPGKGATFVIELPLGEKEEKTL